jgi:hypothetical protein
MTGPEPYPGWTQRMLVGGLSFVVSIVLAVISVTGIIVDRPSLFSIQTLAFVFALVGIFVLGTGKFKGVGPTKPR